MTNNFLAINKRYFELYHKLGINAVDMIIIAQIEEYTRNKKECYMTNEQFAYICGVTEKAIESRMKLLADKGIIFRNTKVVSDKGRSSKTRTLTINYKVLSNPTDEGSLEEATLKSSISNPKIKGEATLKSGGIKDNKKENKKDNSIEKVANAPEEKRDLLSLSDIELHCIVGSLDKGERYIDIQRKYNLSVMVTKDTKRECQIILRDRAFDAQQKREAQERAQQPKIDYKRLSAQAEAHSASMQDNTEIVKDSILGDWEVM